jgi:hypothetical protein
MRRETEENSILLQNNSMERSFIHHKTGEVSIEKLRGDVVLVIKLSITCVSK